MQLENGGLTCNAAWLCYHRCPLTMAAQPLPIETGPPSD